MKLTPLLISVLVFLMSGVMCLFSNSEVHAQNNARREFKFHQENIRSKKRNNDLQKARRGKENFNKENGNIFRVRYTSGSNEHQRTSPLLDGSTKINIESISILYGNWGITKSSYKFYGYWDGSPHEELDLNSYELNFIYGENLTLNFGMVFHAEGTAKVYEWNGGVNSSSYVPKKQKPIYEPHLFGPLSSIYLGYKIGILELIYGINDTYMGFKDFVCADNNCVNPDSQKDLEWGTYPNETIMIGIGLAF